MGSLTKAVTVSLSAALLASVGCGDEDRVGVPAPIEPLSTETGALSFTSNPYAFQLPPLPGQSYTDSVPKTLDLADMAALTLQTMTLNADPVANYKFWFIADWSRNPSRLHHENEFWAQDNFEGDLASQGKFIAPLAWNRLVSGSSFNMLNHRRILEQLFLNVNQTLGMQGSGVRAYEGFIVNYLRDGNALWKTFVLQAAQDMVASLHDFGDEGEEGFWGDAPPGNDIDRQDPWREEALLLAYKYLGYAPALQAVRKHINYVRRSSGMFGEDGSFDDNHSEGPHFHIHALHVQAFLNLALTVQDDDLLDFVNRSYLWAQRRDIGSISLIGYFPELVRVEQNGEGCSLADMVTLAIDLSKTGKWDYWDDADRWIRNHFAEAQLTPTKGDQLQAFSQTLDFHPDSVEDFDYAGPEVTKRSIGGFAGWPSPNDFRHPNQRGIQQCCTGNGARAVFHVWDNIVSDDGRDLPDQPAPQPGLAARRRLQPHPLRRQGGGQDEAGDVRRPHPDPGLGLEFGALAQGQRNVARLRLGRPLHEGRLGRRRRSHHGHADAVRVDGQRNHERHPIFVHETRQHHRRRHAPGRDRAALRTLLLPIEPRAHGQRHALPVERGRHHEPPRSDLEAAGRGGHRQQQRARLPARADARRQPGRRLALERAG